MKKKLREFALSFAGSGGTYPAFEEGMSYYRKLWIRCGNERGGVPFRVGHANPGGSGVEGDATDAEGNGKKGFKGSRPGVV
jgi:hypothetical protein